MSSAGRAQVLPSTSSESRESSSAPSAGDPAVLAYPWGTVRLLSARMQAPPAKYRGAPLGARLLPPAQVELELTGEHSGRRSVTMAGWSGGATGEFRVEVRDAGGDPLWSMGWGADRPGEHKVFESAPGVELRMLQMEQSDGRLTETYALRLGPAIRQCKLSYDPRSAQSLELATQEFGRFYTSGTALDGNFDGRLATSLLQNRKFVVWVGNQLGQPRVLNTDMPASGGEKTVIGIICRVAEVCTFIKCNFGGAINPVCDFCSGVAFGCVLAELFGWI